ncbi:MAG: winged helix DNA-binding protein [Labilithrix sp.]|nr:winged helix DNA-binding protein [Labilithrix sp.]MBX3220763.1 winged helix DNA-binding protein [Labilithrix sp.]
MWLAAAELRPVGRDAYATELEAAKASSTLQLLFKAARLLNERAVERLRRLTKVPVRAAHTTLLPHIDLEGTRLTELARRLGVSKQAVGQLVDELVEMGVLERAADPADARAKLVRFTRRGRAGLFEGLAVLKELERELEQRLGAATMRTVHDALGVMVASYGEAAPRR